MMAYEGFMQAAERYATSHRVVKRAMPKVDGMTQITEHMLEAGVAELDVFDDRYETSAQAVARIFNAMEEARTLGELPDRYKPKPPRTPNQTYAAYMLYEGWD